jgi:hypothetical protein
MIRTPVAWVQPVVRRILKEHSLGITVVAVFLLIWLGAQTTAGHRVHNAERLRDGEAPISFVSYLRTAHFGTCPTPR